MQGAVLNGVLLIAKNERLRTTRELEKNLADLRARDFVLAIDTHHLSYPFVVLKTPLAEVDAGTGAPRLLAALAAYRYLQGNRLIRYKDVTPVDINETTVAPVTDGAGKTSYIIDWENWRPEQQALLLMCYHAHHHQTLEMNFQQSYWAHFNALQSAGSRGRGFVL